MKVYTRKTNGLELPLLGMSGIEPRVVKTDIEVEVHWVPVYEPIGGISVLIPEGGIYGLIVRFAEGNGKKGQRHALMRQGTTLDEARGFADRFLADILDSCNGNLVSR